MFRHFKKKKNTQEDTLISFKPLHQNTRSTEVTKWLLKMLIKVSLDKPVRCSKFSVGDLVRLSIKKTPFMKRYQEIWTEEVFIIHVIVYGNLTTYKIKEQHNESIKRTFFEQELS